MLGEMMALTAALSVAQVAERTTLVIREGSSLITTPEYPAGLADDVRRPNFNGRLFARRPVIGGTTIWARYSGEPGADAYGAWSMEDLRFPARLQTPDRYFRESPQLYAVNAWDDLTNQSYGTGTFELGRKRADAQFEEARWQFLEEEGFTGGVRTHVNDLTLLKLQREGKALDLELASADLDGRVASGEPSGLPRPRANIRKPDDAPSFRSRQRVELPVPRVIVTRPAATLAHDDAKAQEQRGLPGAAPALRGERDEGRAAAGAAPARAPVGFAHTRVAGPQRRASGDDALKPRG